jgi:hypothetical protein
VSRNWKSAVPKDFFQLHSIVKFEVSLSWTVNIKKQTNFAANALTYLPSLSTELLSGSAWSAVLW